MNGVIIMGSSRSDGDTAVAVAALAAHTGYDVLDLATLNFSDYDYQSRNLQDDFLPTLRDLLRQYDQMIFATPVYWYTMSALMKRFLDRISDCLRVEKTTGRLFRGKRMAVLSVSNDAPPPDYATPFQLSAEYLGMVYLGHWHAVIGDAEQASAEQQLEAMAGVLKMPTEPHF